MSGIEFGRSQELLLHDDLQSSGVGGAVVAGQGLRPGLLGFEDAVLDPVALPVPQVRARRPRPRYR